MAICRKSRWRHPDKESAPYNERVINCREPTSQVEKYSHVFANVTHICLQMAATSGHVGDGSRLNEYY